MTLLICYTNYYGAHVFFLPGAHSMLKPALTVTTPPPPLLPPLSSSSPHRKPRLSAQQMEQLNTPVSMMSSFSDTSPDTVIDGQYVMEF